AFEYYEASAYAFDFYSSLESPPTTEEEALALISSAEHRFEYAVKRRTLTLEVFPNHPALRHPLPMTRYSQLQNDAMGAAGLGSLMPFLAVDDSSVRKELQRIATAAPASHVKEQAEMLLDLAAEKGELLTKNASFEEGSGAAAEGWSWWVKYGTGRMARTDAVAHSGKYSVVCEGMKRGGPVQTIPAKPGRYGLMCHVFAPESQHSKGTVELSLTLRDAKGNNLMTPSTQLPFRPGAWQVVAVVHRISEEHMKRISEILPIVIVDGFNEGEAVYFDDLRLYRLSE
ncbi:MAG: hypothetical protein U9Q79_00685, partial [Candidatus Hydrogenedentes bacterium]|nr:hypothetical protein [Candidatus Hydrogenedentota bacterium]